MQVHEMRRNFRPRSESYSFFDPGFVSAADHVAPPLVMIEIPAYDDRDTSLWSD